MSQETPESAYDGRSPESAPSREWSPSDEGSATDISGGPTADSGAVEAAGEVATGPAAAFEPAEAADGAGLADPTGAATSTEPAGADIAAGPHDVPAPPLRRILEAILLVVDEPVSDIDLAQVVEQPRAVVTETLERLAGEYEAEQRGFALRQVGVGWRLYTADDCAPYVEKFVLDGQQARLTQAALETLAVIAYRQPVSRASIAAIRGVNVDGVVRTLVTRGLVAESSEEGPSGAHLYVTTPFFLERLGLRSLDELPSLAPFLPTSIEEIEKEL